jgi:fructose-1,6-bisphosphatase/sedoheptulose 1,7-bisphosphatase-like protein
MGAGEDVLALADLCRGPAVFVATAVTDAWGLPGARRGQGYGTVSTLLVDGRRGAVRRLTSHLPLAE